MSLSFVSIERITEEELRKDSEALSDFRKRGRLFRSDVRQMSDEQLIEKLREFGLPWDRDDFRREAEPYFAAQAMVKTLIDVKRIELPKGCCDDWPWLLLAILWERWLPERPCFETVDDWMQQGYVEREQKQGAVPACRLWCRVWKAVQTIFRESHVNTIAEFDDNFGGTQSLFNWIQDFEGDLYNAGLSEPEFFRKRIEFCESAIPRLNPDNSLTLENFRRAIAESHAYLGNMPLAEQLFESWLAENPRWGWGWIGWSDLFGLSNAPADDLAKAESILRRGLAINDVRDRSDLLERLANLCEVDGREFEADEFCRQAEAADIQARNDRPTPFRQAMEVTESNSVLRAKTTFHFGDEGLPLDQFADFARGLRDRDPFSAILPPDDEESFDDLPDDGPPFADSPRLTSRKIGRNDPCYCGSGKKFKKCCGKLP